MRFKENIKKAVEMVTVLFLSHKLKAEVIYEVQMQVKMQ